MTYNSEETLLKGFKKGILDRALKADKRLTDEKNAPQPEMKRIEDFVD
jgi:TRAP-type mannitol/chloroaromatic compound transport system substrate-binding protein